MASASLAPPPPPPPNLRSLGTSGTSSSSLPPNNLHCHFLSFAPGPHRPPLSWRFQAPKTVPLGSGGDTHGSVSLRKPTVSPFGKGMEGIFGKYGEEGGGGEVDRVDDDAKWIDWEDLILEDTAPLVSFVKMILHSGKYENDDRLSPQHEKVIIEKLLPYHPQRAKKIGSGIDYIKVGYHPDFEDSRCLFIVQKNGELVDFSYWKCIKGLIKRKYPLYAPSFLSKHFRWTQYHEPRTKRMGVEMGNSGQNLEISVATARKLRCDEAFARLFRCDS